MRITFTPEAVNKLQPMLTGNKKLKFLHDTLGCHCGDDGVPTLTFIETPTNEDQLGEADPLLFYYEPRHQVYYDKHMTIHYNTAKYSFSLKSDAHIYKMDLRFLP